MSSTGGWSVQGPPGPTFSTSNTNTGNTNSGIVGGTGNSIITTNNAGILAGTSNTITTTATNAVIGGGSTNTITTALQAGIFCGSTNRILSGCTNAAIVGGSSNVIGTTAACTAGFIGGGTGNQVNNAAHNSGVVAGSGNLIYGGSAAQSFIGAGTSNGVLVPNAGIGAGTSNGVSSGGDRGFIGGGTVNSVAGSTDGFCGAGQRNVVSAIAAGCVAGIGAYASMQTQLVHAGGYTVSVGERQRYELVLRGDTAGAAPAEAVNLKFGVAAGVPTQEITLVNGKTYTIRAIINVTKTSDVTVYGGFFIDAIAKCTGGTVTVDANNTTQLPVALPGGLLGATIAFSGSGTTLRLTGTIAGGLTTASKWTADVVVVETLA